MPKGQVSLLPPFFNHLVKVDEHMKDALLEIFLLIKFRKLLANC